jgi:hypothetical protein
METSHATGLPSSVPAAVRLCSRRADADARQPWKTSPRGTAVARKRVEQARYFRSSMMNQ